MGLAVLSSFLAPSLWSEPNLQAYRVPLGALQQCESLIASGKRAEGVKIAHMLFDTARQEYEAGDQSPIILYLMGRTAGIAGNQSSAIKYLKDSIAKEPDFMDARIALSKAYLSSGYELAAIDTFTKGEERFSDQRRYRLFLAELYVQADRINDAIPLVEAELSRTPADLTTVSFLISLYRQANRSEDAVGLLESMNTNGVISEVEKELRLTAMRLDQGDLRAARQNLQKARSLDPEHPAIDHHFSRYYEISGDQSMANGQRSRAILFWERSLEFDESRIAPRRKLGSAFAAQEDYEKALEYLSGLLDTKPEDTEFYLEISKALHATGKQQSAYRTLDRVIELARAGRDETSVTRFLDLRDELMAIDRERLQGAPASELP